MPANISSFQYLKALTLDTTASGAGILSSDLYDFPVCVVINSASWQQADLNNFFVSSNTGGKRVQFVDSDWGTNLPYEVESYNVGGQTAVYWVKKPQITRNSKSDANSIIVGYGNDPTGADQDQPSSVWDSSTRAVYHLTSDKMTADSTINAQTLTQALNPATSNGVVGTGANFNGSGDFYRNSPSFPTGSSPRTMSGWVKVTGSNGENPFFGYSKQSPGNNTAFLFQANPYPYLRLSGYSNDFTTTYNVGGGSWHYIAAVYDGAVVNIYSDGAVVGSSSRTYATVAGRFTIGSNPWDRSLTNTTNADEVRVSSVARSASWIKAEYYSMKKAVWPGDGWITWSDAMLFGSSGLKASGGAVAAGTSVFNKETVPTDSHYRLQALFNITSDYYMTDFYDITLMDGTQLYYTTADVPFVMGGHTYLTSPTIERDTLRLLRGVEVDDLTITVWPNPDDMVGEMTFIQAIYARLFDNASVTLRRAFFYPDWRYYIDSIIRFKGFISDVQPSGRTHAQLTVKSDLYRLNVKLPRNLYQAGCRLNLYSSECGASKSLAGYGVASGSNSTEIIANTTNTISDTLYSAGILKCRGYERTITNQYGKHFFLAYPLPFTPTTSDSFTVARGCDKTMDTCKNRFNNLTNFRGEPYVPVAETAY